MHKRGEPRGTRPRTKSSVFNRKAAQPSNAADRLPCRGQGRLSLPSRFLGVSTRHQSCRASGAAVRRALPAHLGGGGTTAAAGGGGPWAAHARRTQGTVSGGLRGVLWEPGRVL